MAGDRRRRRRGARKTLNLLVHSWHPMQWVMSTEARAARVVDGLVGNWLLRTFIIMTESRYSVSYSLPLGFTKRSRPVALFTAHQRELKPGLEIYFALS